MARTTPTAAALALCCGLPERSRGIVRHHFRSAIRTALVVGVVLTIVNQWSRLRAGNITGELVVRSVLNFVVPFVVSAYSRAALLRELRRRGDVRNGAR